MLTVVNDKSIYRAIVDARDVDRIKQQTGLYILYSERPTSSAATIRAPPS